MLARWNEGDKNALNELIPLVYEELHRLAATYVRRERRQYTLQPTALVNELYIKLTDQQRMKWRNRFHFFGVAAGLMTRILIDHARAYCASKRGSGRYCVSLRNVAAFGAQPDEDLIWLHESLERLAKLDPDQALIVELRFFCGLTIEETAEVMQTSHSKVEREWNTARAFLKYDLTRTCN